MGGDVTLIGARGVTCTPRARKARGLLAYLSLSPDHAASRREIVDLLWSDRGPDQARASLRQCLFELKCEAPDLMVTTNDAIALSPRVKVTGTAHPDLTRLVDLDPAFKRWRETLLRECWTVARLSHAKRYWPVGILALLALCIVGWAFRTDRALQWQCGTSVNMPSTRR
ncbi:MAG: hypothetical protein ABIR08_11600 [Sphingomonas sp.]